MNRQTPLRSPAALLLCCALLMGALSGVLAFVGQAHAVTPTGKFTLEPGTGSIKAPLSATSASTDAGCPETSNPTAMFLWLLKPGSATVGKQLAKSSSADTISKTAPFTVPLTPGTATVETQLRSYVAEGSLDGKYSLALACGAGLTNNVPAFSAIVQITGETWTLVRTQTTTVALDGPATPVGGSLKLTATLTPDTAVGSVAFAYTGATNDSEPVPVGTADVANGKAEITVTAPATAGNHFYSATFTPADPDAFSTSTAVKPVQITTPDQSPTPTPTPTDTSPTPTVPADLEVTDENGTVLETGPNLEAGQKVKITARGYTKDAKVLVTLADSEEKYTDAVADADGTVTDYAFTVPGKIADGDHTLTLAEDRTEGHSVAFAFTTGAGSDPSDEPDPSASETGSDTGGGTDGGTSGDTGTAGGTGGSGGGTGGGGSMAATGAQVGSVGLAALALLCAGAALVVHVRRKGLLTFGDTPNHL
ncbi:hypothetical protein ACFU9Y_24105 [Streptomyces sp. NPDC057621]|uniref:hypothetical protein n=1 Tax=Streptomyces sp. NPDC057621 TaxID=3346186 RepID=UPI0036A4AF53